MDEAACPGFDTELFFPERADDPPPLVVRQLCFGCPVAEACFMYSTRKSEGVWGGLSFPERRRVYRRANRSGSPGSLLYEYEQARIEVGRRLQLERVRVA